MAGVKPLLLHRCTSSVLSTMIKISQPVTVAKCLVNYRWLKALVASDMTEHVKSLTQLHDLAQREKCLRVVPLTSP